eukprot:gene7593-748_t
MAKETTIRSATGLWYRYRSNFSGNPTRDAISYLAIVLIFTTYSFVALFSGLISKNFIPKCTLEPDTREFQNPLFNSDPCLTVRYAQLLYMNLQECIRTMSVTALGACTFTLASMFAFVDGPMGWDASRISASIPSAAVGVASGGGMYFTATMSTASMILMLRFGPRNETAHHDHDNDSPRQNGDGVDTTGGVGAELKDSTSCQAAAGFSSYFPSCPLVSLVPAPSGTPSQITENLLEALDLEQPLLPRRTHHASSQADVELSRASTDSHGTAGTPSEGIRQRPSSKKLRPKASLMSCT